MKTTNRTGNCLGMDSIVNFERTLINLDFRLNPLRLVQEICMLDNMSRGRLEIGVGRGVSPHELAFYNVPPQEARLKDGPHVVGSPDTVKQQVDEHLRITGSNYFVGSFFFGSLTGEQMLHSLRLFAEEVMPTCRHPG
jgi:alkanesulfonate monooxygenase SsuD/methylene tetrahydromethanopterin reductase-like flavin-dependent oxidoreductase (luciferase family)